MSKGGGQGGGTSTTVQKADPWVGLQPGLQNLYGSASNWFKGPGPQYYPNTQVAPQAQATNTGLNMGAQTAMQGQNPLVGQGQQTLSDTIGGKYLQPGSNPYLQGQYEAASRPLVSQFQNSIAPAIGSQFSAAGRTGSGAHAAAFGQASDALGHSLSDLGSNLYGNAYGQERGMQQAASLASPAFEASSQNNAFDRANKMFGIGQYEQDAGQKLIDADKQKYDYYQNLPLQQLQAYNQLLQGGSVYSTKTGSDNTSMNRNPFAGTTSGLLLGGALNSAGAGLGGAGLLGGALLGGLFG